MEEENIATSDLLKKLVRDKALDEAYSNRPTNLQTGLATGLDNILGGVSNVNALTGNLADLLFNQGKSNLSKNISSIFSDESKGLFDKTIGIAKAPFAENEYGIIDNITGLNSSVSAKELDNKSKELGAKNQLLSSVGLGEADYGSFVAEAVTSLPIARFGTMASTKAALTAGGSTLDVAKAISKDSASNATSLGLSELALAKFYGKTDAEAVGDALVASGIGLLGTPLLGIAGSSLGKASVRLDEELSKAAGGGTPPVSTKSGTEVDSEQVLASKKEIEDIEFDVENPTAERKPIEENVYVPEVKNPKKFKLFYDDVGRVYTEDSSLLSFQGTADQKASLKQRVKESINNADDEVQRRLEMYDKTEELRKRFGRTEAKFDKRIEVPKVKEEADRLRFQIEQYKDIKNNTNLSREVTNQARIKLDELYNNKKIDTTIPPEVADVALKRFIDENPIERISNAEKRNKELSSEFEIFKKSIRNRPGYVYTPAKSIEEVVSNTIKKAKDSKADIVKAIKHIKVSEARLGNKDFSVNNITPDIRKRYRDDVTLIDNFTGSKEDVIAYGKGTLSPEEFMFRARRRVDDEVKNASGNFKSADELNEFIDDIIKKYEDAGTKVTKEQIKLDLGYTPTGKGEQPEAKIAREKLELDKAQKKNEELIKKLKEYKRTKIVPRFRSGQSAGKQALNSSQMKDVDDGILSFKEIADKTSPIVKNAERNDAIKKSRELANKKVYDTRASKLGLKSRFKLPESINFKEAVVDASNSVAQIITVLLGSKRLASLSKLLGTNDDIRSMIGAKMELNGAKMPKGLNGEELTWKDVVKPLFMTSNYGQMDKGLIDNLMKAHNITKEEATTLFNHYQKASDDIAPEMTKFKDKIYELYQKNGKAELAWELPDGFKVRINLSKNKDGTINIRDNKLKVNFNTDDFDSFSRAIMPRLVHSVDAYVARRMNAAGFPTVHDAFVIAAGKEKLAKDTYTKIMSDINESDLLHKIMKDIGYTGERLKDGSLTKADIESSPYKLGDEHKVDTPEASKLRKRNYGTQLDNEGVMRDFMASGNFRQIPTGRLIDSIVNEAGHNNSFVKMAREGDDPFERQVALAMQSPDYNPELAIPAPKNVDAKVWDKTQRGIFNEARAKLEDNPWLNGSIQGERKWFSEDGRIIGDYNKTYNDILEEELKKYNEIKFTVNPINSNGTKIDINQYKRARARATRGNVASKIRLSDAINASHINEVRVELRKSKWQNFKTLWNEQINATGKYKEFNLLQKVRNIYKAEVDRDAEILYNRLKEIPKDKRDELMLLLRSDYESIDGMTKEQGAKFIKDNRMIYDIVKAEVEQGAKGLSTSSEHYGYYLNNATKIANRYDLPSDSIPIIDQMISIRAMDINNAWSVVDKYSRKDKDLEFVVNVMREKRMLSEGELFVNNPEKIVKGYFSEVYRGNKRIDENGKVVWDAESKYEQGILGADRENNRIGTKVNIKDLLSEHKDIEDIYVNYFDPQGWNINKLNPKQQKAFETLNMKYYLDERMTARQTKYLGDLIKLGFDFENSPSGLKKKLDWMNKNKLKEGHDGFRKIPQEDIKLEAGKSNDLADVLTETIRSTHEKIKERGMIMRVLDDISTNESLIFSKTPKDGMTELTSEQLMKLPYELRESVKYVDSDLVKKLIGRNEVRLYSGNNEHLKIADRLLSNFGTAFKQNVVLKSPTSYINAFLVNHTISATTGMTPKQMYKYQKEALKDISEMKFLLEKLQLQKISGQKLDQEMKNRLKNNMLYRLEKEGGLSTNRVDGVVGDDDLLSSILEKHVPSPVFKLARNINLNQNTTAGKATLRVFSNIDTMGRYMVAKKYIDDGMSIKDASDKANGLFGDMDTMVPPSIELLDKYGIAPFIKWFTLTSPALLKLTKDNPRKSLALAIGIYVFAQETDLNLSSVNPLEAMADFIEMSSPIGTIESIEKRGLVDTFLNRAKSSVVPKYVVNAYRSPETLGLNVLDKNRIGKPYNDDSIDYRGFVQQTIEGD